MNAVAKESRDILPWGDPAYVANPYPWYEEARRHWPIYRASDGSYVLTRYDDIVKFGKAPSLTIIDPEWVPRAPLAEMMKHTVLSLDPPLHTKSRRRTNRWFTPKMVQTWAKEAAAFVRTELDRIRPGEVVEANMRLGTMPTHAAMCAALQLPSDDVEPVLTAMHMTMRSLSATTTPAVDEEATASFSYLLDRMRAMVADKRANPGDGMADALIQAFDEGEISEGEMLETLTLFWASGGHNPSYLISSGIECFAKQPDIFELYRSQPEKRQAIINELIRLFPPELYLTRYATEPMVIQDVEIQPGERIRFILDAANHDPRVFPNPEELDPSRPLEAAQNISFGIGPHACAGQVIARVEAEVVFNIFAERVARFEMAGTPVMDNSDRSRAYVELPVTIDLL
jgi:cytochrome P450